MILRRRTRDRRRKRERRKRRRRKRRLKTRRRIKRRYKVLTKVVRFFSHTPRRFTSIRFVCFSHALALTSSSFSSFIIFYIKYRIFSVMVQAK